MQVISNFEDPAWTGRDSLPSLYYRKSHRILPLLRRHALTLLAWPLLGLLLVATIWALAHSHVSQLRVDTEQVVRTRVDSMARGYAEQLRRTVELMDRITARVKFDWETLGDAVDLKQQLERGMHPESAHVYVSVLGPDGSVQTSTVGEAAPAINVNETFFQMHRQSDDYGFQISESNEYLAGAVIRFSRRLNDAQGNFAGVALVTTDPHYLLSFYDEALLHPEDFITVQRVDGPVLATRLGNGVNTNYEGELGRAWRGSEIGLVWEDGAQFWDGQTRIVAWRKLERYPLVAVAAVSEARAMAPLRAEVARTYAAATMVSIFIVAFILITMVLAVRRAHRRQQEKEINETYLMAVDGAKEGFYMLRPVVDVQGEVQDFEFADCNERGAKMLGRDRSALLGTHLASVYDESQWLTAMAKLKLALRDGHFEEEVHLDPNSPFNCEWLSRRIVRSGAGVAVTLRDISDTRAHQEAMTVLANSDPITGLPNRHWLNAFLPSALAQARANKTHLAIAVVDLDDFKNINDTQGHEAGDALLETVAIRLKAVVRSTDHVVRLGGDEFLLILQQVPHVEDVVRVARMAINSLSDPLSIGEEDGQSVQASVGVAVFPEDGEDSGTLLKHADIAMYAAKAGGKGRYHFYHAHLSDSLLLRITREQSLRVAIDRDEFLLFYQPRVDTHTGELLSVEALVRWKHPTRGMVPPIEFIQTAEDTGLIVRLGCMVIEKACAQIAQWKAEGLPVVPVSINVSALQFNNGHVKSILSASMKKYRIEPELIGVELTESCMVGEGDAVAVEIDALRSLGVKLLVDDFGTGYSSLSQLQRLNVDVLKIDRAFTITLGTSDEGKALFKAIVSMADALDIEIVAEGVETTEQLNILRTLNCGEVQGHLISEPVPAEQLGKLLTKRFLFSKAAQLG